MYCDKYLCTFLYFVVLKLNNRSRSRSKFSPRKPSVLNQDLNMLSTGAPKQKNTDMSTCSTRCRVVVDLRGGRLISKLISLSVGSE